MKDPPSPTRLIFGLQPVREAIRAHGSRLLEVVLETSEQPRLAAVERFASDHGIHTRRVDRGHLDRLCRGGYHQGAVAVAPALRLVTLEQIEVNASALILVLDGVMDPQNFGAAIRSAVALGATAIVWPEHASAPLSPATFRASAGAIEHAALCRVASLSSALQDLASRGVTSIALDPSAEVELPSVNLCGPVALVIGAEDRGVRHATRKSCTSSARLPMAARIGSLNASVAAALGLYETQRQRAAAR